ncbi:hypothetical protein BK026_05960 [Alteromonas sp. V450]|nr:hypothetical protein BK026_05960 [Alteromonas sp. V450]
MQAYMPIGIVDKGTTSEQRVITSTLAKLDASAVFAQLQEPALVYVGEVVNQRQPVDLAMLEVGAQSLSI